MLRSKIKLWGMCLLIMGYGFFASLFLQSEPPPPESPITLKLAPVCLNPSVTTDQLVSPYNLTTAYLTLREGASQSDQKQLDDALLQDSKMYNTTEAKMSLAHWIASSQNPQWNTDQFFQKNYFFVNTKATTLNPAFKKKITEKNFYTYDECSGDASDMASLIRKYEKESPWLREYMLDNRQLNRGRTHKDEILFYVMLNYLKFQGEWEYEFEKANTDDEDTFTCANGTSIPMTYMHKYAAETYVRGKQTEYLRMNFKKGIYAMEIILPNEGISLQSILPNAGSLLTKYREEAAYSWLSNVDVLLPPYEHQSQVDIHEILARRGLKNIRSGTDMYCYNPATADQVYTAYMQQSNKIRWDEKGAEAVSFQATHSFSIGCSAGMNPGEAEFHATRPFLYTITNRITGEILFLGTFSPSP